MLVTVAFINADINGLKMFKNIHKCELSLLYNCVQIKELRNELFSLVFTI